MEDVFSQLYIHLVFSPAQCKVLINPECNGGPFSLVQLKVIQEIITLCVFSLFTILFFKNETLRWNHGMAFLLLIGAVYLVFRK